MECMASGSHCPMESWRENNCFKRSSPLSRMQQLKKRQHLKRSRFAPTQGIFQKTLISRKGERRAAVHLSPLFQSCCYCAYGPNMFSSHQRFITCVLLDPHLDENTLVIPQVSSYPPKNLRYGNSLAPGKDFFKSFLISRKLLHKGGKPTLNLSSLNL